MPAHEVCLHVGLLEALTKSGIQRRKVIDFLHRLCEDPSVRGDYTEKDVSLREREVKITGNFAVPYWLDAPARIVMVVDVRRADQSVQCRSRSVFRKLGSVTRLCRPAGTPDHSPVLQHWEPVP